MRARSCCTRAISRARKRPHAANQTYQAALRLCFLASPEHAGGERVREPTGGRDCEDCCPTRLVPCAGSGAPGILRAGHGIGQCCSWVCFRRAMCDLLTRPGAAERWLQPFVRTASATGTGVAFSVKCLMNCGLLADPADREGVTAGRL